MNKVPEEHVLKQDREGTGSPWGQICTYKTKF